MVSDRPRVARETWHVSAMKVSNMSIRTAPCTATRIREPLQCGRNTAPVPESAAAKTLVNTRAMMFIALGDLKKQVKSKIDDLHPITTDMNKRTPPLPTVVMCY